MIISGNVVMFLDPSQRFLPQNGYRKRRALRSTISRMRVYVFIFAVLGIKVQCSR